MGRRPDQRRRPAADPVASFQIGGPETKETRDNTVTGNVSEGTKQGVSVRGRRITGNDVSKNEHRVLPGWVNLTNLCLSVLGIAATVVLGLLALH